MDELKSLVLLSASFEKRPAQSFIVNLLYIFNYAVRINERHKMKLFLIALSVKNCPNLNGKTKEIDKTLGILLVINFVCVKGGKIFTVK